MPQTFDIAVIGAGIAGASVATHLAQAGKRVVVLEMESQPGYHATGRSAAIFAPSYGPAPIRALTHASEAFFVTPPKGFTDTALFRQRSIMMITRDDQMGTLDQLVSDVQSDAISVVNGAEARRRNPLLREGYAKAAMIDRAGQDIDVSALHQGYLHQFKAADGTLLNKGEVLDLTHGNAWQVETRAGVIEADIVVNAAGAWADLLGQMAGAEAIGLTPKRRTALMIAPPEGLQTADYPSTCDIDEQFYMKPDAGHLLISPADETPCAPCDAQPDEMDVAVCVDRIETAFDVQVQRIESKWAGLRSFVADGSPVAGFSGSAEGFYWFAGQGGYGIQSAPALAEMAAAQILGRAIPSYITNEGFDPTTVSPMRFGGT